MHGSTTPSSKFSKMLKRARQRRSRLESILNVAQRLRLRCFRSAAALLDELFEHPARLWHVASNARALNPGVLRSFPSACSSNRVGDRCGWISSASILKLT